jgi:hypothetical protein
MELPLLTIVAQGQSYFFLSQSIQIINEQTNQVSAYHESVFWCLGVPY